MHWRGRGTPAAAEFKFRRDQASRAERIPQRRQLEMESTQRDTEERPSFEFSFSGLKTAVLRYIQNRMGWRLLRRGAAGGTWIDVEGESRS